MGKVHSDRDKRERSKLRSSDGGRCSTTHKKNKYIYIINVSLVSSLICAFLHHLVVTEARQPN